MNFFKKLFKLKQTKAVLTVALIVALLAAAFLLAPDVNDYDKIPITDSSKASSEIVQTTQKNETTEIHSEQETAQMTAEAVATATKVYNDDTTAAKTTAPVTKTEAATKNDKTEPLTKAETTQPKTEEVKTQSQKMTCTISIRCDTVLNNMEQLKSGKESVVPSNGKILSSAKVSFSEGETVFDVLKRVTRDKGIHLAFKFTPMYNSSYIQGIHNLYEFDCGPLSGWMYKVNGRFPNYGCSRYTLSDGDKIEWVYTCDLGADVGGGYAAGQ